MMSIPQKGKENIALLIALRKFLYFRSYSKRSREGKLSVLCTEKKGYFFCPVHFIFSVLVFGRYLLKDQNISCLAMLPQKRSDKIQIFFRKFNNLDSWYYSLLVATHQKPKHESLSKIGRNFRKDSASKIEFRKKVFNK